MTLTTVGLLSVFFWWNPFPKWRDTIALLALGPQVLVLLRAKASHRNWTDYRFVMEEDADQQRDATLEYEREYFRRWSSVPVSALPSSMDSIHPARFPDLVSTASFERSFQWNFDGMVAAGSTMSAGPRPRSLLYGWGTRHARAARVRRNRIFFGLILVRKDMPPMEGLLLSRQPPRRSFFFFNRASRTPVALEEMGPTGDITFDQAFVRYGAVPELSPAMRERLISLVTRFPDLRLSWQGGARVLLLSNLKRWNLGAAGIQTLEDALAALRAL